MAAETPKTTGPLMSLGGWLALIAFLVGIGGALYLWRHEAQTPVLVPVPARDLPAYHQIQSSDLAQRAQFSRHLTSATLRETTQIVGRYTLTEVPQQQPLSDRQLGPVVDTTLISDTVAVGIQATPAMVLGDNLQAGDVVDLILVPATTEGHPSPTLTLFEHILVLDVRSVLESRISNNRPSDRPFVVVIALPLDRRLEFATRGAGATLLITRKP